MEAKEVLGEPGRNKVFAGGTVGKATRVTPGGLVRSRLDGAGYLGV